MKTRIRLTGRAPRWRGEDGGQKRGLVPASAAPELGDRPAGLSRGVAASRAAQSRLRVGGCPPSFLSLPSASFRARLCPHLPEMSDSREVFIGLFWLLRDTQETTISQAYSTREPGEAGGSSSAGEGTRPAASDFPEGQRGELKPERGSGQLPAD